MNSLLNRILRHKPPSITMSHFILKCPYKCGYKWELKTTLKTKQILPVVCKNCGKKYSVQINPSGETDFERIVYLKRKRKLL